MKKVTSVRAHIRKGRPVRQHSRQVRGYPTDRYYTEIAGWRKGIGETISKDVDTEAILDRLETGTLDSSKLTDTQKKNVMDLQVLREERKRARLRERRQYRELAKRGKVW